MASSTLGVPVLPQAAIDLFEKAAVSQKSSQEFFEEAYEIGMEAMKMWYMDDERKMFEVVKDLARPICRKVVDGKEMMTAATFGKFCTICRKMIHYHLKGEWAIVESANVEVLDEAQKVCERLKNPDGLYGTERLSYGQAMKKEIIRVKKNLDMKKSPKIPPEGTCILPHPKSFLTTESFLEAIWDRLNRYLGHSDLEEALSISEDLQKVQELAVQNANPVAEPVLV